jgi:hypothetical protein
VRRTRVDRRPDLGRERQGRRQTGIKGRIAAWTAAAESNGQRKHPRTGGSGDVEPRRSDSPGQQLGYPYSHSPASAPALQEYTHTHLPPHPAHVQTLLMTIGALAPAARDFPLGVGKRVEKFYRARSANGVGRCILPIARCGLGYLGLGLARAWVCSSRCSHRHSGLRSQAHLGWCLGDRQKMPVRCSIWMGGWTRCWVCRDVWACGCLYRGAYGIWRGGG